MHINELFRIEKLGKKSDNILNVEIFFSFELKLPHRKPVRQAFKFKKKTVTGTE
ncbi:hypothetical protein C943_01780 [Mariniradius saccharolyticus AK6]|uniref:Uncharacterized protein n=1 Tax=Mariniradius saccharolyticus AK6 TaxID=1239962 RepID=M7Y3L6_9BACT|nr:hypothetical protein C943_01780 [Mariniradius saccharolyticus AK6]